MRGTGRYNIAQGTILTAQGIGAALSTTLAGVVVVHAGYSAAFLTLAGVALAGPPPRQRNLPSRSWSRASKHGCASIAGRPFPPSSSTLVMPTA